jgi:hypothetical protein
MSLNSGYQAGIDLLSCFWFLREGMSRGKVGILFLDFHFSTAVVSRSCGNVEIAHAISKGGGQRRETCIWFSSLSATRHFRSFFVPHAIFLSQMQANSFCFAFCIAIAAWVSLCAPASRSSFSTVISSLRNSASPGK